MVPAAAEPQHRKSTVLCVRKCCLGRAQGVPWPESEKAAVDVVMQYALQRLGFHVEDIVLFSWSIGGFDSTFAAMAYPDIRYLVRCYLQR